MNLTYKTTSAQPDKLRVMHIIVIETESLATTRQKEVLTFARSRISSKSIWKELKEAVRLGEHLQIIGGGN